MLNAGTTLRLGWCRGFEQLGIPYCVLGTHELTTRLPELQNPFCLLTNGEYLYLDRAARAALRQVPHLVWVDHWFQDDGATFRRLDLDDQSLAQRVYRAVLATEPAAAYTISPPSSLEYYHKWVEHGLQVVSLPLACDPVTYHLDTPRRPEFDDVEMAFVGGYWPYKARQFDRYLRPYQDRLKVYGYAPWPYAGYGGRLDAQHEATLYRQAKLAPTINEPQAEALGLDLNERVFKVLGSGGCTLTDAVPGYRDWFTPDELPVPASLAEYHELVETLLHDAAFNRRYRKAGHAAVMARHTYAHRAQSVLDLLHISVTAS